MEQTKLSEELAQLKYHDIDSVADLIRIPSVFQEDETPYPCNI